MNQRDTYILRCCTYSSYPHRGQLMLECALSKKDIRMNRWEKEWNERELDPCRGLLWHQLVLCCKVLVKPNRVLGRTVQLTLWPSKDRFYTHIYYPQSRRKCRYGMHRPWSFSVGRLWDRGDCYIPSKSEEKPAHVVWSDGVNSKDRGCGTMVWVGAGRGLQLSGKGASIGGSGLDGSHMIDYVIIGLAPISDSGIWTIRPATKIQDILDACAVIPRNSLYGWHVGDIKWSLPFLSGFVPFIFPGPGPRIRLSSYFFY
jgi:hypothetical protein